MEDRSESIDAAAYGGEGWSPRLSDLRGEIGRVWAACAVSSEWSRLRAVLLHQPGPELEASADPDAVQMLEPLDPKRAREQHDAIANAYCAAGVAVHHVEPADRPSPNQMFVADLMFMTPEGAILARPASTVRAGEERAVARRLADLGVPILRSVRGSGTFEGADAAWLDPKTVMLGLGLRTNAEGAAQVTATLGEMGVDVIAVDLPHGTMHLMGLLRFADRDLAVAWPRRLAHRSVEALRDRGYEVAFLPDEAEGSHGKALNFVTLGPREILTAAGNPNAEAFYRDLGITCRTVAVDELGKAAGSIGCLSGILHRDFAEEGN
jgi:N-dimethylarginine dimethylaminohydrolase